MPNLTSTTATNSTSAPASWTNITSLTGTITPASSGSVILLIANVPITFSGTDASADFRFADGGSAITGAPVLTCGYSDNTNEGAHGMLVHALTGATGSHTYTIQWQDRTATPTLDSGRTQSFQIIELLSAEATLQVDVNRNDSTADPAAWADVTNMTGTYTPASASVNLMIANLPTVHGADLMSDFQFAVAGTREGLSISQGFDATGGEGMNSGMMWAKTGVSVSTTFSIQWQERSAGNTLDSGRNQTFQVIELKSCDILADDSATSGSAPGTYADVPSLTEAVTVGSTGSVVLMMGHIAVTIDGTDRTADFRFADGSTNEGPEMTLVYSDGTGPDHGNLGGMAWAKTGISGSKTLSMRWQDRTGTPAIDTGRTSTFQVLELKVATGDVTRSAPQADLAIDEKTPTLLVPSHIREKGFRFRNDGAIGAP